MKFRTFFIPALAIASTLLLASCANTVRGVGEDVKGTAQAVADVVN
ncbi:MAG: entericidin EcnAB [Notoacmeibacter sp.]